MSHQTLVRCCILSIELPLNSTQLGNASLDSPEGHLQPKSSAINIQVKMTMSMMMIMMMIMINLTAVILI